MGVDTGLLVRFTRGLLTELGIVPEGVFNVSRDQWETGNQMAVTEADYLETLAWMRDELRTELRTDAIDIPVDKPGLRRPLHTINPREIKFDPRSIAHAAKIFHLAGESWTMPRWGWDQTNFGLFSGDDRLGAERRPQRLRGGRAPPGLKDRHIGVRARLPLDPVGGLHLGRATTRRVLRNRSSSP